MFRSYFVVSFVLYMGNEFPTKFRRNIAKQNFLNPGPLLNGPWSSSQSECWNCNCP